MNANFAFPRPQQAVPRPPPAGKSSSSSADLAGSRESNALRASILDTALELGIGSNSLVADWMFNNPVLEETEEEESVPSPGLTYGSPTSEESTLSPSSSLLHSQYRRDPIVNVNGYGLNFNLNQNINQSGPLNFQRSPVAVGSGVDSQNSNVKVHFNANEVASNVKVSNFQTISLNDNDVTFPGIPVPPRPTTPLGRKLRKKRAGKDSYESDGGYVSESGKKKDKKKGNSAEGQDVKQRLKEDKKKKNFIQAINKISTTTDVQPPVEGYESDGGSVPKSKGTIKKSKTKNSSNHIGYETDVGYQSSSGLKKSKTRFFKLTTKSSRVDIRVDASASPLPNSAEKESESVVPLPIAERFATTLSPTSNSNSMSSPATTEGGESRMGTPQPALGFRPFPDASELTSTTSLPSARLPTFNQAATAPASSLPSAFNAIVTHLHAMNRDSRSSFASSSSSGSGSNQPHKPQKRFGLFSPLQSPPSSMQGPQQHGLRSASSLSSLKPSHPVISLPVTRATSPTSAGLPSSHLLNQSRSVSPLPPYVSPVTSVAPLHINKGQRTKPNLDNLPLPAQQHSSRSVSPHVLLTPTVPLAQTPSPGAGFAMVRPRNPPTDGFGPRSAPPIPNSGPGSTTGPSPIASPVFTPAASKFSSDGLSPHPYAQAHLRQPSQHSIVPSSDYIVPSPRNSPLKTHAPALPNPNVLAYYHHDHIPPQPSPAPIGPLPTVPSSVNVPNGNGGGTAVQFPSVAQLRQRMTIMRRSVQHDYDIGLSPQKVRESFSPSRPVFSPPPSTVANGSVSVGSLGLEARVGNRQSRDLYPLENSDIGSAARYQEQETTEDASLPRVAANRQSWIDINEEVGLDKREKLRVEDQEAEEPEWDDILDRFETRSDDESNDIDPSSLGGQALERSRSFMAGKIEKEPPHYPVGFSVRPLQSRQVPANVDVSGFEDGRTVGDRTSRWSGSVYSRASILDEGESEETRDRFVKRVEAMLDAEKKAKSKAQAQAYIPPLPKISGAYANIVHPPNGYLKENAGAHSAIPPGRSWNKF